MMNYEGKMDMDYSEFAETSKIGGRRPLSRRKFKSKLDVEHIDVKKSDRSRQAQLVRIITAHVSDYIKPRKLISLLFILAAYTITFLVAVIISDLLFVNYEVFQELSDPVSMKLSTTHDVRVRLFSAALSVVAILIEVDNPFIEKSMPIVKSFIPRSMFLLLVSTLSEANPMITYERKISKMQFDDDIMFGTYDYTSMDGDDDRRLGQSNYNGTDDFFYQGSAVTGNIRDEIPDAILVLPLVSSAFLKVSVFFYFVFGVLCIDRFKPNAFVPSEDESQSRDDLALPVV